MVLLDFFCSIFQGSCKISAYLLWPADGTVIRNRCLNLNLYAGFMHLGFGFKLKPRVFAADVKHRDKSVAFCSSMEYIIFPVCLWSGEQLQFCLSYQHSSEGASDLSVNCPSEQCLHRADTALIITANHCIAKSDISRWTRRSLKPDLQDQFHWYTLAGQFYLPLWCLLGI